MKPLKDREREREREGMKLSAAQKIKLLREALVEAKLELQVLGRDLQELEDGTRSFPTALLDPDTIEWINTVLERTV